MSQTHDTKADAQEAKRARAHQENINLIKKGVVVVVCGIIYCISIYFVVKLARTFPLFQFLIYCFFLPLPAVVVGVGRIFIKVFDEPQEP